MNKRDEIVKRRPNATNGLRFFSILALIENLMDLKCYFACFVFAWLMIARVGTEPKFFLLLLLLDRKNLCPQQLGGVSAENTVR